MIDESRFMNPQALISIFGGVPELESSELLEMQLKRDGPTLFVRLMTKQSIQTKPKRWQDKWDVIYIEMSFIGIRDLSVDKWGTNNLVNLFSIQTFGEEGLFELECNDQIRIKCRFDWVRVEGISPGLIGTP